MTDRRKVLAALAAGAAAIPAVALSQQTAPARNTAPQDAEDCCLPQATTPASGDYFPNVPVETHDGQRALFYNDLLRGKLVLVNFMSVANDAHYPVTENLARVQQLLGARVGRDVFMISITVDPLHDTPGVLQRFARAKGAGPGWNFVTGQEKAIELIKGRFFVHPAEVAPQGGHQGHHGHAQHHDCSMGLVRYGNEAAGLWGSVAAKSEPAQIVERLAWISPRPPVRGKPRRRGPATIVRSPHPPYPPAKPPLDEPPAAASS